MSFITKQQIYEATDGGLNVILKLFPQAAECLESRFKKFKMRKTEKTASSSLKSFNGIWKVTDFGGDGKAKDCIQCVMDDQNLDFSEAIKWIGVEFGILPEEKIREILKPEISSRAALPEEITGTWTFDFNSEFTAEELKVIFAEKVISQCENDYRYNNGKSQETKDVYANLIDICRRFNLHSLKSYTMITSTRKALTFSSTKDYPIFCFDYGTWQKILKPKEYDKGERFRYYGGKPEEFINGLTQCQAAYQKWKQKEADENEYDEDDDSKKGKKDTGKLPAIILCSGDRDALNVAACGYEVVWLNSESAKLSTGNYINIARMCDKFYNLCDIDATGLQQAHELAMMYLDIYTIMLPKELSKLKDWRGNSKKDVRDYLATHSCKSFDNLVKQAMPYRFWDEKIDFDKNGKPKGIGYDFNNVYAYNFLERNGFYRMRWESVKEGYIYIQIDKNRVKQIEASVARGFINNFLATRKADLVKLRNTFYRSTQLNEGSLSNLAEIELDFTDYDKKSQWLFFENKSWEVTDKEIIEYNLRDTKRYVWENEVMKHQVELLGDFFTITQDSEESVLDIEIHNNDCLFFRFLINTCRMHWRTELETNAHPTSIDANEQYFKENQFNINGPRLTEDQRYEQRLHLINRIYCLGYLMHRYKDPAKPWAVWVMENQSESEGESHGGSGKSIAFKSIMNFMQSLPLDGRNTKLTDNVHIYENITKHTDYVLVNDAHQYLNFNFFFAQITDDMTINPKNMKQHTILYEDSPKFCFTSNYAIRDIDGSTARRIIYSVFSDWYHNNQSGAYNEERLPTNDFGKNLFKDFTKAEWNLFINFMGQCLKFFLNSNKQIQPPMENVLKRSLHTEMGDIFLGWADIFFSPEAGNSDVMLGKQDLFKLCLEETKLKFNMHKFTKSLKAFCKFRNFQLNPDVFKNSQGRISRTPKGKTTEMIYVKTKEELNDAIKEIEFRSWRERYTDRQEPLVPTNPEDKAEWEKD